MDNNRLNADQNYDSFSLKDFLMMALGYWKWFLASIVVFVGIGLFFIYTRQPVFEREEEILVKDQETGGGMADVSNSFSTLGLFANQTKVYNELISFTSPAVMFEVVKRLELTMNYDKRKGLRKQTLYGTNLPIHPEFPDLSEKDNVGFRIKITPAGSYTISKLWKLEPSGRVKFDGEFSGKIGDATIETPIGRIAVNHNPGYFHDELAPDRDEDVVIDVFRQSLQGAVEKYVEKLKGDLTDQDADVIKLSIRDTSVERADDILNMIVTVYNERWIEDKNKVALATSKFISERLDVIKQELDVVDDEIADNRSKIGIADLEKAAEVITTKDLMMSESLLKATNFLAMTTFLKEYLENPANQYNVVPMNTGTENPILEEQIGLYNTALLERNKLMENSSTQNPLVRDKDVALAGMRNSLLRSVESQISNLKNAIRNIDANQAVNQKALTEAPQKAKILLSGERQQLVMEELYLFLLQKREETELTQTFTADNTRVITPPYGRQRPVSPKKALWLVIFFIIGVGVPGGALFISEACNTKIRSKKDLENLSLPFAGEIPHIGKDRRWTKVFKTKKQKQKAVDKPKIIVSEGKRDIPNEAFRVVRSNIDFMLKKGESVALALTSFNPGSGKSFVAFNLGASFALKGKRVLIIDGDLRHGSMSDYVNSPRKGLSNYLTGNTSDWSSLIVQASDFSNLYVLPIGHKPPNPAELLENGKLGDLIEEAKKDFDIILIDCPPVNIVVDTQIINQYVARTLFVVRAGLLEKKGLGELSNLVEEKKLNNITVLLNGTKTEFSSYHTYGNYEAIDKI